MSSSRRGRSAHPPAAEIIHQLYAFDVASGRSTWATPFSVASGQMILPGAVADGQVFAESTDGSLYVLDAGTGSML